VTPAIYLECLVAVTSFTHSVPPPLSLPPSSLLRHRPSSVPTYRSYHRLFLRSIARDASRLLKTGLPARPGYRFAIDLRLINMIGSAGEEIGERANGWLSPKDIPLLSRNLLSDDSGNDSRFTENLDTRLKSVGLANSRHYTTSHDT